MDNLPSCPGTLMPTWATDNGTYYLTCGSPLDPPYDVLIPVGISLSILAFWFSVACWFDSKTNERQHRRM